MSEVELPFDRVVDFFAYASEREDIRLRRASGAPKPWTDDPILQQYRFCNVFREDDVVTRWVKENIRQPFWNHPDLWLMLAIARTINLPSTLEYCFRTDGMPNAPGWKPWWLTVSLNQWQDAGNQVYTGAYMIRAESDPNKHWYSWRKNQYVAEIVIGRLWNDRADWQPLLDNTPGLTLERVWEVFQSPEYIGWGPFMAYEVVTDMRHTRYLRDAPDISTWANPGPGAARGICRLLGLDKNAMSPGSKRDRPVMMTVMRELMEWANSTPELWPHKGPWEMRDVEHTLCEFDKYERVRLGEGKPRAMYNGAA